MTITFNELLQKPTRTLLCAYCNMFLQDGRFVIRSSFRQTNTIEAGMQLNNNIYQETALKLTTRFEIPFIFNNADKIECQVICENLTLKQCFRQIYLEILSRISQGDDLSSFDVDLAIALFGLRGSPDFTTHLYAVDIIRTNTSKEYIDNLLKLILNGDSLPATLNFNFRELQPEYIEGTNRRNSQIRINLKWFYDNCLCELEQINEYKTSILNTNENNLGNSPNEGRLSDSFIQRIRIYKNSILGRGLNNDEISQLRQNLNFENDDSVIQGRNQNIVSYIRETTADECVGCCDNYKIEDRSFIMPNNNNHWYLEINHVLPFSNNKGENDVIDNLVKLCAVCHRALTPNRAKEELQKSIIKKMIESRKEVDGFVEMMMLKSGKTDKVQFVLESLM